MSPIVVAVSTLLNADAGSGRAEGVPAGLDLVDSEGGVAVSQVIRRINDK